MHSSGLLHILFNNKYNNNIVFQCNYNIHSILKDVVSIHIISLATFNIDLT